jgi:hypothetical protein
MKVSLVFGGHLRDEVDSSGGDDDDAIVSNACSHLDMSSFRIFHPRIGLASLIGGLGLEGLDSK